MGKQYINVKKEYMAKNDYFDKEYVDEQERQKIMQLSKQEKEKYLVEHDLYEEKNAPSDKTAKYFRVRYWDLSEEELERTIRMNQCKVLERINKTLSVMVVVLTLILIFIILGVIA